MVLCAKAFRNLVDVRVTERTYRGSVKKEGRDERDLYL